MIKKVFTSIFLMSVFAFCSMAQSTTIVDELQKDEQGKGKIVIKQSEAIRSLVGYRLQGEEVKEVNNKKYLIYSGCRVQIYSDNRQRTSKEEAYSRERKVKESFPGLATYVTYVAPFWKLRVGDCRTYDEAYHLMLRLKEALPQLKKEMYIVDEVVRIPLD